MERLTHEADFGLEDWEETLFFVKSDPNGAYNILDVAKYQGEPEFDEILKNVALRLAAYENTGLKPETISGIHNIVLDISEARLRELAQADREGRCVVLDMPREPLVWGDDDQDTCLCPYCGKDLMGIPYGERMVLQCPECGQYLDATKVITREEAEEALRREQDG